MIAARKEFARRDALAEELAADVGQWLEAAIAARGHAVLAVSGGSTPRLFLEHLSHADIGWNHVTITLVDERQVAETSPRSNARLVREFLLRDRAGEARFVPLNDNPAARDIAAFDVAILGMGADGHTASYFPGGDRLLEALDPQTRGPLVEMTAPGAGEPRITFVLGRLLSARHLVLHIEGADKRAVLERALGDGPVDAMPVRAVLRAATPVTLYWCP
jgi:6-phosphogluconolactonase